MSSSHPPPPVRPGPPRVTAATKTAFGLGQAAEGVKNTAFNLFLLFYYNQVLGVSGSLAGLALFIATAFDAVTDPLVGSLSDRFRHRWGRRHPFMYISAIPLGISFALIFRPPDLGETGLFLWLTGFAVLVRGSMTLFHVPHLSLGAELSSDYTERTSIAAVRTFFALIGATGVVAAGWLVFFRETPAFPTGQLNPAAYPPFGLLFGALMALAILLSALGTHHVIDELPKPDPSAGRFGWRSLVTDYTGALSNPSFRAFFLGVTVFFVMRGVQEVLGVHMWTYFWRIDREQILAVALAAVPGLLLGVPAWTWIAARLDKGPTFLLGISLFSVMVLAPPIGKILGWYPGPEQAAYLGILAFATFLGSFAATSGLVLGGSMMADIADEHELETHRRQEGIFFAALAFAAKSTSGLGSFLAGVGLDWIDFPVQAQPEDVSEAASTALGVLYAPGIGALALVSILLLSRYRIDRARHDAIAAELASRRAR